VANLIVTGTESVTGLTTLTGGLMLGGPLTLQFEEISTAGVAINPSVPLTILKLAANPPTVPAGGTIGQVKYIVNVTGSSITGFLATTTTLFDNTCMLLIYSGTAWVRL
jgi:hypothetical protein